MSATDARCASPRKYSWTLVTWRIRGTGPDDEDVKEEEERRQSGVVVVSPSRYSHSFFEETRQECADWPR
ncbi:hypothetical protein WH47_04461 [Habropoda laboriosa]|uniref:Uncharacterized protein n=1 Tax=Habropoda laboriosa TaxID=597456 RepID=A0A0L7R223_9HYME|nr:hypothetical protein WH47_04461 [Habropoda laboriosa]